MFWALRRGSVDRLVLLVRRFAGRRHVRLRDRRCCRTSDDQAPQVPVRTSSIRLSASFRGDIVAYGRLAPANGEIRAARGAYRYANIEARVSGERSPQPIDMSARPRRAGPLYLPADARPAQHSIGWCWSATTERSGALARKPHCARQSPLLEAPLLPAAGFTADIHVGRGGTGRRAALRSLWP